MTDRSITAMYDIRGAAESARNDLIAQGVAAGDIAIHSDHGGLDAPGGQTLWDSLSDLFMPAEDQDTFTEGLNRGGYLLSAKVPESLADEAVVTLERYEPIDLERRSERWRREGWQGAEFRAPAPPVAASTSEGAEDEPEVDSRAARRARLRVRSYAAEAHGSRDVASGEGVPG